MNAQDDRLRRLENGQRRTQGVLAMLVVGWLVTLVWMLAPRPRLDAREFALRDSTGARRGALMMRNDGSPVVRLDDRAGRPRLYGVVLPDGNPRLRLTDSAGVHRVVLEIDEGHHPRLRLSGADGRMRAQVFVTDADRAVLELGWGSRLEVITPRDSSAERPDSAPARSR